jgi:putative oxidoreductase
MQLPILLIGRILFMVPFLMLGLNHFIYADAMAGAVPTWVPGGKIWVYLTGIFNIAGAVAIVSGFKARLAGLLLAILLLSYVLTVHLPGMTGAADQGAAMNAMVNLLKDLGLAGGALIFAHAMTKKD